MRDNIVVMDSAFNGGGTWKNYEDVVMRNMIKNDTNNTVCAAVIPIYRKVSSRTYYPLSDYPGGSPVKTWSSTDLPVPKKFYVTIVSSDGKVWSNIFEQPLIVGSHAGPIWPFTLRYDLN